MCFQGIFTGFCLTSQNDILFRPLRWRRFLFFLMKYVTGCCPRECSSFPYSVTADVDASDVSDGYGSVGIVVMIEVLMGTVALSCL